MNNPADTGRGSRRGHHRRPLSIDGRKRGHNVSYPPSEIHELWHEVVYDMCAPKICVLINALCAREGRAVRIIRTEEPLHRYECPKRKICPIHCGLLMPYGIWLREHLEQRKQEYWLKLRAAIMSLEPAPQRPEHEVVIEYINKTLIDPDYQLVLETRNDAQAAV